MTVVNSTVGNTVLMLLLPHQRCLPGSQDYKGPVQVHLAGPSPGPPDSGAKHTVEHKRMSYPYFRDFLEMLEIN